MAEYGESLSEREMDVIAQLKLGASNKEIAQNLFISSNTVKVHLRNINTKLGASSRTEALARALEQGLLTITADKAEPPEEATANAPSSQSESSPAEERSIIASSDPSSPSSNTHSAPETVPEATTTGSGTAVESEILPQPAPQRVNLWLAGVILLLVVSLLSLIIIPQFSGIGTADNNTPVRTQDEQIEETEWYLTNPLPVPRVAASMITVGSNLYLFGGQDEDRSVQNNGWRFSAESRTWSAVQNKPTAVSHAASAELTGFIYVIGGVINADHSATNKVEVYSPVRDLWRAAAELPQPLSNGLAISDDRFIYYIGGRNGDNISDLIYQYDEVTDSWQIRTTLPESMPEASAALLGNQLYIMGGSTTSACHYFDLATGIWHTCAPLPNSRINGQSFIIKDKIYLFGGSDDDNSLIYDPQNDSWSPLLAPLTLPTASAATQIETQIYFFGGEIDGTLSTEGYRYAPLVHQWFLPNVSVDSDESASDE